MKSLPLFAPRRMRAFAVLALPLLLWLPTGCSHKCPRPPPCIPPPPVVTVVKPPPCKLPELPAPIEGLGVPDATRDGYFVPRQRWAELGGYVAGVHEWVKAATDCLAGQVP